MRFPDVVAFPLTEAREKLACFDLLVKTTVARPPEAAGDHLRVVRQRYLGDGQVELLVTPENWERG